MSQGVSNANDAGVPPAAQNLSQARANHSNIPNASSSPISNNTSNKNAGPFTFGSSNVNNNSNTFSFKPSAANLPGTDPDTDNRPMSTFGFPDGKSLTNTNKDSIQTKTSTESNTAHSIVFTNSSLRNQSENQTTQHPSNATTALNDNVSPAERSLLSKLTGKGLVDVPGYAPEAANISSPLYSVKSFEQLGLKKELLTTIAKMGFRKPSKIQEITLPTLLAQPSKNVIAQSQSGTGKTGAFSLAILSKIDPNLHYTQALVVVPTYELALQIGRVIEMMAELLPYARVGYAVRRSDENKVQFQKGILLQEPIVVGTPGTIEEWCSRQRIIDLSQLTMFCMDEADIMMSIDGFQLSCSRLIEKLNQTTCQMMLFSATYSDDVLNFVKNYIPNATTFRLKREKQALPNIMQYYVICENEEAKFYAIESIYAALTVGQGMIFCRTKQTARALHIRLANQNHSVRELTSDLDIEQRATVINLFRENRFRVLISTNVTSRGIDIEEVTLVINYDMPIHRDGKPDHETYLHRIGRCGRFGKIGYAFNLIGSEHEMSILGDIQTYFDKPVEKLEINDILRLGGD